MSEPAAPAGQLILVVGVGRSGTSLLAGMLGQMGFQIPQPEVKADTTNPRGFGEPRWVVDFHKRMLRARRVTVNDSRPAAWAATYAAGDEPENRRELRAWLSGQLAQGAGEGVVVKDPRTVWFLPLWTGCARELGMPTASITMLRHPAEVVTSAKRSYGEAQSDASRTCAWLNVILETEHATRDGARALVHYEALLRDWPVEMRRVGGLIGAPVLAAAERERLPEVDRFVDPTLHRNRVRWDTLDVPARVRDLAEEVWDTLGGLTREGGDDAATRARLDALRASFLTLHAEAESIAQSSILAARRQGRAAKAAPRPSLRVRAARRIPAPHRARMKRAIGLLRKRARPRDAS